MQHDVTALALRILATALVGPTQRDSFGLTVVRLGGPASAATGRQVRLLELSPPQPDNLTLINLGTGSATVQSGEVTSGGMADRVVTQAEVIASGGLTRLRVEPLLPRWSLQGDVRLAGAMGPLGQALVELMTGDRAGVRSVARTALWDAARDPTSGPEPAGDGGWALFAGVRPLAARLIVSAAIGARPPAGAAGGGDQSRRLVRTLSEAIAAMDLRVSRLGLDRVDIMLVRRGFELADVVIGRRRQAAVAGISET